jgi:phage shock protein PspC (stress-responsive transcriptional regulator)
MRKLHRSRRTKVLGGVAAGFAEYFSIDVTVMRLLLALLAVTIPNAILAYILAWIIIPEEPLETTAAPGETATTNRGDTHMDERVQERPKEASVPPPTADELLGGKQDVAQAWRQAPVQLAPVSSPAAAPKVSKTTAHPDRNRQLFGYILIFVGAIVLARKLVPSFIWRLPTHLIGEFWPVLIILVGAALIFGAIRGR